MAKVSQYPISSVIDQKNRNSNGIEPVRPSQVAGGCAADAPGLVGRERQGRLDALLDVALQPEDEVVN